MRPNSVLSQFESYLCTEKRFSDHTVLAYMKDIEQFAEFAEIKEDKEYQEVNHQLVRGWIVALIESKVSNRTVNRKLSTLRTFFKWAQIRELVDSNPLQKIQGPKTEKRLTEFAKPSEMSVENLEMIFPNDFDGIRDKLMIEVFYQTGIRLSELIELREDNVTSRTIKVLGKRNKERLIPISDELFSLMNNYKTLKIANALNSNFFFVLNNGNKLYPKFVYRKINSYLGGVTNLDKKSPHVLRHTFATHMLNNGAGLETLKDLLGHSSLAATQVYTHNSFAQINNIYSQAHPRGHKKN